MTPSVKHVDFGALDRFGTHLSRVELHLLGGASRQTTSDIADEFTLEDLPTAAYTLSPEKHDAAGAITALDASRWLVLVSSPRSGFHGVDLELVAERIQAKPRVQIVCNSELDAACDRS